MSSHTQTGKIRVQIWSLLEQDPKLLQNISEQENNSTKKELSKDFFYQYSVNEIKNLAPFVFEGIIHGWKFSYTPYDKTRQVNEYFEFSVDGPNISKNDKNISYKDPYFQDNKLFCWIEYLLTPAMLNKMNHSKSIVFKKISGKGKGKVSEGEEGIKKAFSHSGTDIIPHKKSFVKTFCSVFRKYFAISFDFALLYSGKRSLSSIFCSILRKYFIFLISENFCCK